MARHRTPTNVLKLAGTYRADRHGDRIGEVEPTLGFPDAPEWMLPEAKAEWERLRGDTRYAEAIAKVDRAMLATYCQLWARFVAGATASAPVPVSHVAALVNLGAKLGLNPADRSKVKVPEPEKPGNAFSEFESPLKTFLGRKRSA